MGLVSFVVGKQEEAWEPLELHELIPPLSGKSWSQAQLRAFRYLVWEKLSL